MKIVRSKPKKVTVGNAVLWHGDCRDVLERLDANDIHACVTDPPYGLAFMGKDWDKPDNVAFNPKLWAAVMNALRPGGHLVAFGGTRMYHRLACAIDDSGFEVRDMLAWLYGSGFPKGMNIGKMIDKYERGVPQGVTDPDSPNSGKWVEKKNVKSAGPNGMVKREHDVNGFNKKGLSKDDPRLKGMSKTAKEWLGYNLALKPAIEPVCMARKPLEMTAAKNVLKYGTGAINIDECRLPLAESEPLNKGIHREYSKKLDKDANWGFKSVSRAPGLGRYPANVMHDGSPEVLGLFPTTKSGKPGIKHGGNNGAVYGAESRPPGTRMGGFGDEGSAARFFYCAKANRKDRDLGLDPRENKHPTVKPLDLMQYLIRLTCIKNGIVLDPFMGSGSTGVAALREGCRFVGIEQDPDFFQLCVKRMTRLQHLAEQDRQPEVELAPIDLIAMRAARSASRARAWVASVSPRLIV